MTTTQEALEHIRSHRVLDVAYGPDREAVGAAMEALERQIEIVHCKDCHVWMKFEELGEHAGVCLLAGWMIGENGFCLYGERKVEE